MTGVHWLKPLKVYQILSKKELAPVKEKTKPVVKAKAPKKESLTKSLGTRVIHLEDEKDKAIGFGSKKVKGQQVLQTAPNGQGADKFNLEKIKKGTYKGMYILRNVKMDTVISVYDDKFEKEQWLT